MREADLQAKIKKKLEAAGWLVVKLIQTSANGIPDLMALRNGTAIFIEVKALGKKARPLQEFRINQLTKQGFTAKVIDQIEQIYEFTNAS
jgi:Holliday junction resolvase